MAWHQVFLEGERFGRLTVLCRARSSADNQDARFCCRCDCGQETIVRLSNLKNQSTRSCGCLRREHVIHSNIARRTHGHAGTHRTRTYSTWAAMLKRCHNPRYPRFNDYGGRGISVCRAWRESFASFLSDMGERPLGRSIDRIDNRFGYFFANCRWATPAQQAANRRCMERIR